MKSWVKGDKGIENSKKYEMRSCKLSLAEILPPIREFFFERI
jgi:hypothetical protein